MPSSAAMIHRGNGHDQYTKLLLPFDGPNNSLDFKDNSRYNPDGEITSAVALCLHLNGENASTSFPDSCEIPKTVSAVGSAQISTAQSKFGGSSLYLEGTTSYLSVTDAPEFVFGSGSFSMDCWVRFASLSNQYYTFASHTTDANNRWFWGIDTSTHEIRFFVGVGGGFTTCSKSWTPSVDTWYHVAVVRTGGNLYHYVNGSQVGTSCTFTATFPDLTLALLIGMNNNGSGYLHPFNGYINEFRVSRRAEWSTGFTPLTHAYRPGSAGLLRVATIDGSPVISTAQYKFQQQKSSYYMSDSAYDFSYSDSNELRLWDGDFTIDFFYQRTGAVATIARCLAYRGSGGGTNGWQCGVNFNGTNDDIFFIMNSNYIWTGITLTQDQWYHIAFVRSGTTLTLYLDGVSKGDKTASDNVSGDATYVLTISGRFPAHASGAIGYYSNVRLSRGVARWKTSFTPPTAPYQNKHSGGIDKSTMICLHCDGTNGSTSFPDASEYGRTITANGAAQVSTAQQKFGTGSYIGTGNTADYLSAAASNDWYFASSSFTIDMWVRFDSVGIDHRMCGVTNGLTGSSSRYWGLYWSTTNGIYFINTYGASLSITVTQGSAAGWSQDVWYHVAVVRDNNNWRIYKDGVSVAYLSVSVDFSTEMASYPLEIGKIGAGALDGYIDEFRITKGWARWLGSFTPPVREYK